MKHKHLKDFLFFCFGFSFGFSSGFSFFSSFFLLFFFFLFFCFCIFWRCWGWFFGWRMCFLFRRWSFWFCRNADSSLKTPKRQKESIFAFNFWNPWVNVGSWMLKFVTFLETESIVCSLQEIRITVYKHSFFGSCVTWQQRISKQSFTNPACATKFDLLRCGALSCGFTLNFVHFHFWFKGLVQILMDIRIHWYRNHTSASLTQKRHNFLFLP